MVRVLGGEYAPGEGQGEADAEFARLCGRVMAPGVTALGGQSHVVTVVAGEGLAVLQAGPVLGKPSPHALARQDVGPAQRVEYLPGGQLERQTE